MRLEAAMPATERRPGILIVNDDVSHPNVLERTLQEDNYTIHSVRSGKEALEAASSDNPDLVILDVSMPEQDGLELCRSLKSNAETEDIVVIFLSSVTEVDVKTKGFRLGAVDYILKPVDPSELRARVHAHLRLKERLDELRRQYQDLRQEFERGPAGKVDPDAVDQSCVLRESKSITFTTDVARVQGVVNQLLVGVSGRLGKKLRNDLALGIHEMVLNAVEHGNLGITSEAKSEALENQTYHDLLESRLAVPELSSRSVTISYTFDGETVCYAIRDEGTGFDWQRFLERDEPEDLLASNGRGILISRYIFDRITYNDAGNEVRLEKKIF